MSKGKKETCKLYSYWNDYSDTWTLYSVEATVLPKSYKLHDRTGAFGYSGVIPKDHAMYRDNPADAFAARMENLEEQIRLTSDELQTLTTRLNALKRIARGLP